jgi:predicted site-specific integrase-resolvase
MKPEKLYDYKQLSELTGRPVGTLRTWKMEGRIKCVKFGSRVMFPESYVEELLKNGVPPKNGNN